MKNIRKVIYYILPWKILLQLHITCEKSNLYYFNFHLKVSYK